MPSRRRRYAIRVEYWSGNSKIRRIVSVESGRTSEHEKRGDSSSTHLLTSRDPSQSLSSVRTGRVMNSIDSSQRPRRLALILAQWP
jgi:hypothetical protein